MKIVLGFFLIFLANLAHSELRSSHALKTQLSAEFFKASLNEGYHFNYKAPNKLLVSESGSESKLEPTVKEERNIQFLIKKNQKALRASLYVCDDKVTFCETHNILLNEPKTTAPNSQKGNEKKFISKITQDENGFLQGPLEEILKKNKKMAVLDFSAKWCPGCVRFETEVFPDKNFRAAAKNFLKIKIDTDLFENFSLAEKYQIVGIPTLIFTDDKGNEIQRMVGFDISSRVIEMIKETEKDPTLLSKYKNDFKFRDLEQQLRAGQRLNAAEEYNSVINLLKDVSPPPPEFLNAKVSLSKKAFEKDEKDKVLMESFQRDLEWALSIEGDTTRSIGWRTDLIKIYKEKKLLIDKLKKEAIELDNKWMASPADLLQATRTDSLGEFVGMEKWVALMYKVDLLEAAGLEEKELQSVYAEAAKVGVESNIPITKTGLHLRLLIMMMSAKDWSSAESQVQKMLAYDPQNFELKRRYLKVLVSTEKFEKAKELGIEILKSAPGRNEFWVAELLAKSYIGLNDMTSARQIITQYLGKDEIKESKMKSTKSSFEKLLASTELKDSSKK